MIAWVVEAVIASTVLMLLVMLVRRPVAAQFGAQAAYALWALPALRMVLPPLAPLMGMQTPLAPIAPMAMVAPVSGSISDMVQQAVFVGGQPVAEAPVAVAAAPLWIALAVCIWLCGGALFLAGHVWGYRRFRAHLLDGADEQGDVAPGIGLVSSSRANGPMAFGLRRRLIVFPADAAERFDDEEHALALAHELAHHRRGDLYANAFALVIMALHWWNPVAWRAYRLFRADQEVACDAQVIAEARQRGLGQAYGRALIKAATNREFAIACHLTSVETLKRRLSMLARTAPSRRRRRLGLMLIGGATLGGLAFTASGEGIAADVAANVSEKVASALPARAEPVETAEAAAPAPQWHDDGERRWREESRDSSVAPQSAAPGIALAAPATSVAMASASVPPLPPVPPVPASARSHAVPPVPPVPPRQDEAQWRKQVEQGRREAERAQRAAEQAAWRAEMAAGREERRRALNEAAAEAGKARAAASLAVAAAPRVSVTRNCTGARGQAVSQIEQRDRDGRTRITINVCNEQIARDARAQAIAGLMEARASIVQNGELSDSIRATIQHDMDREIARLRAEQD